MWCEGLLKFSADDPDTSKTGYFCHCVNHLVQEEKYDVAILVALNLLISKSVYTCHNVSSNVIVRVFRKVDFCADFDIKTPQ